MNNRMKKIPSPGHCFVTFALPHFLFVEDFEVRQKSVLSCSLAWNISLFPDNRAREEQIDRVWSMVKAEGIGPPAEGFEQRFKTDIRMLIEQKMDLFPQILCNIPSPALVNQGRYDVLTVTINDKEEKRELPIFPSKEGMPLVLQVLMTMQRDTSAQVDNIRKFMSFSDSVTEEEVATLIATYSVQRADMMGYHRTFSQWRDNISDPLGSQGIALGFQLINDINANTKTILSLLRED